LHLSYLFLPLPADSNRNQTAWWKEHLVQLSPFEAANMARVRSANFLKIA
jgi:hypothetical protein